MTSPSPLRARLATLSSSGASPPPPPDRPGAATGHRAHVSPVEFIVYGPVDEAGSEIVATFGEGELEYAALRRGAGLLDSPHRGTLIVRGADRRDLLNRLVTQELKDLGPGLARAAFLVNRQGRIQADLLIADFDDRTVIALDLHQAEATRATLDAFVFTEDVEIADASAAHHHLWLDGPAALAAVETAAASPLPELAPLTAAEVSIAGAPVVVIRADRIGDVGLTLITPAERAGDVHAALLDAEGVRPVGWYAFNSARVEAGTPLFNVDFGTSNLPHETGLLEARVSFTKGCYPGQEIVARIEHLGRPKQGITGLRVASDRLPVAGDPVFAADGEGDPIGVVTSSTICPMLGATPVALAMLRTAVAERGAKVKVAAEGDLADAEVVDRTFWSR